MYRAVKWWIVVTRNDVARLAGTSPAVVSYVMNNGPKPVSAATRSRVLAAVEELGYRPNAVARSLRARRTWTIGVIASDSAGGKSPFFGEFTRSCEDVAWSAATPSCSATRPRIPHAPRATCAPSWSGRSTAWC